MSGISTLLKTHGTGKVIQQLNWLSVGFIVSFKRNLLKTTVTSFENILKETEGINRCRKTNVSMQNEYGEKNFKKFFGNMTK